MTQPYGTTDAGQPGYAQPAPAAPPAGPALLGKRRNPFAVWILGFVTIGIYFLVWVYKTNNELRQYDSRIEVKPGLTVLAFFPFGILYIPGWVAEYRTASRVAAAQRAAGVPEASAVLAFILWAFILGTGVIYLQAEINKIWDRYPGAEQGQEVPLFA